MTKRNKFLAFSTITAISMALAACDDSAGSANTSKTCSARCEGETIAVSCDANGNEIKTDCSKTNQVCGKSWTCVDADDADNCVERCNGNELITCDANGNPQTENCGDAGCSSINGKFQCGGNEDKKCTDADNKCDGNILHTCANGKLEPKDCAADSMVCNPETKACEAPKCTDADNKCDGNTLHTCANGKLEQKDCAADNMICNPDTKACEVPKCTEDYVKCDGSLLATCVKGQEEKRENCADDGLICNAEAKKCEEPEVRAGIGNPCTCTAESCTRYLTGKELKTTLDPFKGLIALLGDIDLIKDDDAIAYPDFFSKDIKGCEGIVPPAGMEVGCFRDASIQVTSNGNVAGYDESGFKAFITALESNKLFGELVKPYTTKMHTLLGEGIEFSSPNGYCLTAAIGVKATLKGILAEGESAAAKQNAVDNLTKLINAGDHDEAKKDTSTCPEGSVKFSYEIAKEFGTPAPLEVGAKFDVGFDMCLQSCTTDDDCRKDEGYSCVEIPNGVPGEGEPQQKQKACFDGKNIEYFENLTNQFQGQTEGTASN